MNSNKNIIETKALPGPTEQKAKSYLSKLAILATQICAQYKWVVGLIEEFYPNNEGLLGTNINKGMCIQIRLRSPHNPEEFYSWYELVGTLSHELAHNSIGPHSEEFFKLMDKIQDSIEKLPKYEEFFSEMDGSSRGFQIIKNPNKKDNHDNQDDFINGTPQKLGCSCVITGNGTILKSNTIRGNLKQKMAQAAIARSGLINTVNTANKVNKVNKPLTKEEKRLKVLESLEKRGLV
jgi:hypothetical protein